MRLQLWSYNYAPEPTGIGPVSAALAKLLAERGWSIDVVAAHPHYPEPRWGRRLLPYREEIDGVSVIRLPLWIGRRTAAQRLRQEASFAAVLGLAAPFLGRPLRRRADAMVVASPSFPALAPAIVNARLRRLPWVLWLHDLLPDAAVATGLLPERGAVARASRRLERAAYRAADRIAILSAAFEPILVGQGVPAEKLELIPDPATLGVPERLQSGPAAAPPSVLAMGNIGFTQGLAPLVAAFQRSAEIAAREARLVIVGTGVAEPDVRAEVRDQRVQMRGLLAAEELERELASATLALVSQVPGETAFNLPSKLMNFMARGLPVIAAVNPRGEVARIVREAGAGWIADSSDPDAFPRAVAAALDDPDELRRRGAAAHRHALKHYSPSAFGDRFDALLRDLTSGRGRNGP